MTRRQSSVAWTRLAPSRVYRRRAPELIPHEVGSTNTTRSVGWQPYCRSKQNRRATGMCDRVLSSSSRFASEHRPRSQRTSSKTQAPTPSKERPAHRSPQGLKHHVQPQDGWSQRGSQAPQTDGSNVSRLDREARNAPPEANTPHGRAETPSARISPERINCRVGPARGAHKHTWHSMQPRRRHACRKFRAQSDERSAAATSKPEEGSPASPFSDDPSRSKHWTCQGGNPSRARHCRVDSHAPPRTHVHPIRASRY